MSVDLEPIRKMCCCKLHSQCVCGAGVPDDFTAELPLDPCFDKGIRPEGHEDNAQSDIDSQQLITPDQLKIKREGIDNF